MHKNQQVHDKRGLAQMYYLEYAYAQLQVQFEAAVSRFKAAGLQTDSMQALHGAVTMPGRC
jgi:hypothetical protein